MSTKYTPGPWSFVEESGDCKLKNSSGETMMCDMSYYPWTPDSKEDWQLIAAAPELLEALKMLLKHGDYDIDPPKDSYGAHAYATAKTAIEKAEGKA